MNFLKVFSLFIVIQLASFLVAHVYYTKNPDKVLLVVDTSFSMKDSFPAMQRWIEDHVANSRYHEFDVATDKAPMGSVDTLKSLDVLFRTVYGKLSEDSLKRYQSGNYDQRILLSDGTVQPRGWDVITFGN